MVEGHPLTGTFIWIYGISSPPIYEYTLPSLRFTDWIFDWSSIKADSSLQNVVIELHKLNAITRMMDKCPHIVG